MLHILEYFPVRFYTVKGSNRPHPPTMAATHLSVYMSRGILRFINQWYTLLWWRPYPLGIRTSTSRVVSIGGEVAGQAFQHVLPLDIQKPVHQYYKGGEVSALLESCIYIITLFLPFYNL